MGCQNVELVVLLGKSDVTIAHICTLACIYMVGMTEIALERPTKIELLRRALVNLPSLHRCHLVSYTVCTVICWLMPCPHVSLPVGL